MDNMFLFINRFCEANFVSVDVSFEWTNVLIRMKRDNNYTSKRITNKELESSIADVVITTTLGTMVAEINENYPSWSHKKEKEE